MENNTTYVIVDISEIDSIDYSQVLQTSPESARKNIDNTRFILKYDGDKPSIIELLDNNKKLYKYNSAKYFTHPQIIDILLDVEWVGTQSLPFN